MVGLGMATSVKKRIFAQEGEYGTQPINSVGVIMAMFGMEHSALLSPIAVAEKDGTKKHSNATAHKDSSGMDIHAFNAQMENPGIRQLELVYAPQAPNGTLIFAQLYKIVMVE